MNKNMSFETAMNQLNEIVVKLESGETSLDESLKLFEEGTKVAKFCNDVLDSAEQKITNLSKVNLSAEGTEEASDEEY